MTMSASRTVKIMEADETVRVETAEEMRMLGKRFASAASPGDVIALYGEPGAGKTEFVRGFVAEGTSGPDPVSSPTFTLIHEYEWRMPVYHFDAYRVEEASELIDLGLDEYLFGDGVCLIEWPGVIESLLPDNTIRLYLRHESDGSRSVSRSS